MMQLFKAANGRTFAVVLIQAGETFGVSGALIASRPLVEFWDTTHRHEPIRAGYSTWGQFTGARYNLLDILNRGSHLGLCLMGGEPAWTVDGDTMDLVQHWLLTSAAQANASVRA